MVVVVDVQLVVTMPERISGGDGGGGSRGEGSDYFRFVERGREGRILRQR